MNGFPLTRRYLGAAAPEATTPDDFLEAVCRAHARGDIPSRAVRDLARYEAALLEIAPAPPPTPLPADDAKAVIGAHARVLVYGAALPEMVAALREGKTATPRPARGWIVLWKDAGGAIHERVVLRMEGWLLEAFREPARIGDALEDDEDRALFAQMWNAGVLVPAS